jgi:CDP-diacylglycerol---glycerol-3-phosphate 3-phosphatidyltransferase
MFGAGVQRQARAVAEQIVRPVAAWGISPNVVSLLGLVFNGVAAGVIAVGLLRWGGALVLLAGIFDMFDGAVARAQQRTTRFGAFLDSTLDRYAEGMLFLGVILSALRVGHATSQENWIIALAYVAALFSLTVSYIRARAEGVGLECKVGLMERPERVILLGVGLLIGGASWLLWVLVILVVTTGFTGVQRIVHVWRQSGKITMPAPSQSPTTAATHSRRSQGDRATPTAEGSSQ